MDLNDEVEEKIEKSIQTKKTHVPPIRVHLPKGNNGLGLMFLALPVIRYCRRKFMKR